MQILTSQALRFYDGDRGQTCVVTPGNIQEVPDWAEFDETFQAARWAGLITVVVSSVAIPVKVEPTPSVPGSENPAPAQIETTQMDDEIPVDDGTLDVKSLAAKIGLKIGETTTLLKEKYNFVAQNGKTILPDDLFAQVVTAETAQAGATETITTDPATVGGF